MPASDALTAESMERCARVQVTDAGQELRPLFTGMQGRMASAGERSATEATVTRFTCEMVEAIHHCHIGCGVVLRYAS